MIVEVQSSSDVLLYDTYTIYHGFNFPDNMCLRKGRDRMMEVHSKGDILLYDRYFIYHGIRSKDNMCLGRGRESMMEVQVCCTFTF